LRPWFFLGSSKATEKWLKLRLVAVADNEVLAERSLA
jgi:hypothetical protein